MKFCHLIIGKIINFVAIRCQMLKCTEFNFGWGSAPDPAGRALQRCPDSLAGFNWFTFI